MVELDWRDDQAAVVIGSGPSALRTQIERAWGRARIIAVNNSWKLAPFADVLYGCDASWWFHNNGVPEFQGRKYTSSPAASARFGLEFFHTLGSNSGIRAIYLAQKFGARRILLVGFDMHVAAGAHWHPPHGGVCREPTANSMVSWRAELDRVTLQLRKFRDVNIINCTPGSALTCFPMADFAAALDGDNGQDRSDTKGHHGNIA